MVTQAYLPTDLRDHGTPGDEPTVRDYRQAVRQLIESEKSGGYLPLRKHEKRRAYYCLTGEKLQGASNGEVSYRLIEWVANGPYEEVDVDVPDPYDTGGPLKKAQIEGLIRALYEEADDA